MSGKSEPFDIYAHDIALQIKSIFVDSNSIVRLNSNTQDPKKIMFQVGRNVDFQKAGKYVLPDTYADAVIQSHEIEPEKDSSKKALILNEEIKSNEDSIYKFTSKEVLLVTMAFNAETNDINITSIKTISNKINCTNDADDDAVIDGRDSLPKIPGDFTANGKPDYDLDGVADLNDRCSTTYGTAINKGCPVSYFYTKKNLMCF